MTTDPAPLAYSPSPRVVVRGRRPVPAGTVRRELRRALPACAHRADLVPLAEAIVAQRQRSTQRGGR